MTDSHRQRPRILVTRPEEDASATAEVLIARGYDPIAAPLLDIEELDEPEPDLDGVQALLATSANGIRTFAHRSAYRQIPVFAVGDATAREARRLGFARVSSADGDVGTLADLVLDRCRRDGGDLLHVAGSRVAGDLGGILEREGYGYRRVVLYRMRVATALPATACAALADDSLDGVLVYSPRTAATFAELAIRFGFDAACAKVHAFCLSTAVAKKIAVLDWRGIHVAERPEQNALLDCLDSVLFATSKG